MTSAFAKPPEKCISATFKDEKKLQDAVQNLLNRGVPKERISIIGRNFQIATTKASSLNAKRIRN